MPLLAIACSCILCLKEWIDCRVCTASICVLFDGFVGEGGFDEAAFMVTAYAGVVGEFGSAAGDSGTSRLLTEAGLVAGFEPGW